MKLPARSCSKKWEEQDLGVAHQRQTVECEVLLQELGGTKKGGEATLLTALLSASAQRFQRAMSGVAVEV